MGMAICFKCGSEKSGALLACGACGTTPRLNSELALSLVLTDHLSSKTQLAYYSHELRNHLKFSVPSDALAQAQEALKDPQLMAMLGAQQTSGASALPMPTAAPSRPTARSEERRVGKERVTTCRSRGSPHHKKKKQKTK